jgi:hypothetical protein
MYNGTPDTFISYNRLPNPIEIRLGDNTSILSTHYGSLLVQNHRIEALHTPTFRHSLLSVGEFDNRGYSTLFANGQCTISSDDSLEVALISGHLNGKLYQIDAQINHSHALLSSASNQPPNQPPKLSIAESRLWHKRLAHLHTTAMKDLIKGYTHEDELCEICILAKHERKIIRIPVQRTTTPFELVHSDTCGPFATKSQGGAVHFIVFIDDYTRYTFVYFLLDKKSETYVSAFQLLQH